MHFLILTQVYILHWFEREREEKRREERERERERTIDV